MKKTAILGAGISGLSTSFHLGHENTIVYEASDHYGGHVYSELRDGFTWDDGPHVAFGDFNYVHSLFRESVEGDVVTTEPVMNNYFRGTFINHPAQSHLYQVPEPIRSQCLNSFLETRADLESKPQPANYREWLHLAFGPIFAETFPAAYTRKYWTTDPANLGTDWIDFPSAGLPRRTDRKRTTRVYYPSVEDVVQGSKGPLGKSTHYVKTFLYPARGGFCAFLRKFADGSNIQYGKTVHRIHLAKRELEFTDGTRADYEALVSTIPLPVLVQCVQDAPKEVSEAGLQLRCTRFYLVEVTANHPAPRPEHWIYVYDEDKYSVRISITEKFSPNNAPPRTTGISVEVYGSEYKPLPRDTNAVALKVQNELVEMGLLESLDAVTSCTVRYAPWANVIFDHNRSAALDIIMGFLKENGVFTLGRYGEWEYLMTHDCVMGGRQIAEEIRSR